MNRLKLKFFLKGILENKENKNNMWNNIMASISSELNAFDEIQNINKFYQNCVNRTTKLWPIIMDYILMIGQLQLLRVLIAFQLNMTCKFDAKNIESSLRLVSK